MPDLGDRVLERGTGVWESIAEMAFVFFETYFGILGVKNSATNWPVPVLRECGQEPLQVNWVRSALYFITACLGLKMRSWGGC